MSRFVLNRMISLLGIGMSMGFCPLAIALPTNTKLAQLFYPPANDHRVIAVTGQGKASIPADRARLNFTFTNQAPNAAFPGRLSDAPDASPKPPTPEPITEPSLVEVVTALKQAGVPSDKIMVVASATSYRSRNASISVDLEAPTQAQINQLVNAVSDAVPTPAGRRQIYLGNIYVQYLVNSCEAVETEAYGAALADAQLRATAIATKLGITLPNNPSVAELPFLGRFYSPCSQEADIVDQLFQRSLASYNPELPAEVTIFREIAVTYQLP